MNSRDLADSRSGIFPVALPVTIPEKLKGVLILHRYC
jgi:hypothetical protein